MVIYLTINGKIISVDLETYEKVCELCGWLGVGVSEFLHELVDAVFHFSRRLREEFEYFVGLGFESRFDCWRTVWVRVIDKGLVLSNFSRFILEIFGGLDLGFDVEDIDWLSGFEGLWISFTSLRGGSPWIDDVDLHLHRDGSAYVEFWSMVGFRDELGGEFDRIADRLREVLEKYLEGDEFFEISGEIEMCGDMTEFDLRVEVFDDTLCLIAELYTSNWHCIPSFKLIEKMFRSIYRLAELENLILKRKLNSNNNLM